MLVATTSSPAPVRRTPYCDISQADAAAAFEKVEVAQFSPKLLFRFSQGQGWANIETNSAVIATLLKRTGGLIPKQSVLLQRFRAWQKDGAETGWALGDSERACLHLRRMLQRLSRTKRSKNSAPPKKYFNLQHLVDLITIGSAAPVDGDLGEDAAVYGDESDDVDGEADVVVMKAAAGVSTSGCVDISSTEAEEAAGQEIDFDELALTLFSPAKRTRFLRKTAEPSRVKAPAPLLNETEFDELMKEAVAQEGEAPLPAQYKLMKKPAANTAVPTEGFVFEEAIDVWIEQYMHLERSPAVRKRVHSSAWNGMRKYCKAMGMNGPDTKSEASRAGIAAAAKWASAAV